MSGDGAGLRGRLRRASLETFGRLPAPVRRAAVRAGTTSYTVGCLAVLRREKDVLLLEQAHLPGLSLPGGLLERGETPQACVRREVQEELGVDLPFAAQPHGVVVDGDARRIDLVFVLATDQEPQSGISDEVQRARWLPPDVAGRSSITARALAAVLDAGGSSS